jgi:hypothetical protein
MLSPRNKGAGKRFREPFGKAGLTVAILALVFAMVGGAWAAAGLNSKQKKEVKSIAKSFQGTGPAGAAGPAGAKGDNGSNGTVGAKGDAGSAGAPGESVKLATATGCGAPGGTKLTVGASSKEVCNGSPWTAGGTLPSGTTVTGAWTASSSGNYGNFPIAAISFPLPAKEAGKNKAFAFTLKEVTKEEFGKEELFPGFFEGCKVEEGNPECVDTGCSGTAFEPTAPKGELCVYAMSEETNTPPEDLIASSAGEFAIRDDYAKYGTAILPRTGGFSEEAYYYAYGAWALNAP